MKTSTRRVFFFLNHKPWAQWRIAERAMGPNAVENGRTGKLCDSTFAGGRKLSKKYGVKSSNFSVSASDRDGEIQRTREKREGAK